MPKIKHICCDACKYVFLAFSCHMVLLEENIPRKGRIGYPGYIQESVVGCLFIYGSLLNIGINIWGTATRGIKTHLWVEFCWTLTKNNNDFLNLLTEGYSVSLSAASRLEKYLCMMIACKEVWPTAMKPGEQYLARVKSTLPSSFRVFF